MRTHCSTTGTALSKRLNSAEATTNAASLRVSERLPGPRASNCAHAQLYRIAATALS
jgi:hypothetical protein